MSVLAKCSYTFNAFLRYPTAIIVIHVGKSFNTLGTIHKYIISYVGQRIAIGSGWDTRCRRGGVVFGSTGGHRRPIRAGDELRLHPECDSHGGRYVQLKQYEYKYILCSTGTVFFSFFSSFALGPSIEQFQRYRVRYAQR